MRNFRIPAGSDPNASQILSERQPQHSQSGATEPVSIKSPRKRPNGRRGGMETYSTVVAVNQYGMVPSVEDEPENRLHGPDRDILFLRALHVEDMVLYPVLAHKCVVPGREIFLHQRPVNVHQ